MSSIQILSVAWGDLWVGVKGVRVPGKECEGVGFGGWGLSFWDLGCEVEGSGCGFQGSEFRVWSLGLRGWGLKGSYMLGGPNSRATALSNATATLAALSVTHLQAMPGEHWG